MVRYLLFFSYVGTKFSGSQRQAAYDVKNVRVSTVQDALETALLKLRPRVQPKVSLASRTDAGVHALCSTGHVDLMHFMDNKYYHQDSVTYIVNKHFEDNEQPLRILRTLIVPDTFNSRFCAKSRTYVYRVAVQRVDPLERLSKDIVPLYTRKASQIPLFETDRVTVVSPPFDIDAAKKATSLFLGTHNFTSFMKKPDRDDLFPRNPVRFMEVADLSPGIGFMGEHDPFKRNLEYWDFTFRSSGFLQRQVRRMVGTVVAVARGRLTCEQVRYMLDNPSHESWLKMNVGHTNAEGLYLKEIEYDEKDLRLPSDYFDVILNDRCSYTNKSNWVCGNLISALSGRIAQLQSG